MDQLYTVDEVMNLLKVSRPTLYRFMEDGVVPYVQLGGQRRFIGNQLMSAIKKMQIVQNQSKMRDLVSVQKDTLSDASRKLTKLSTNANKELRKFKGSPDNIRDSKFVKRSRAK